MRRRWDTWTLAVAFLMPMAVLAAPVPPGDAAAKFETAKGDDAVKMREDILANAPAKSAITDRERYVSELGQALIDRKIFEGTNVDGQLSAAITMAQLQAVGADKALNAMLASPNAGVRYWGARGIMDIAGAIKMLGTGRTLTEARMALNNALGKETSHVVKKQIIGAVVAIDDTAGMIGALQRIASQLQAGFPDPDSLQVIVTALGGAGTGGGADAKFSLAGLAKKTLNQSQKTQVGQAVANIVSFAVQQQQAMPVEERPPNYHEGVLALVNAGVEFVNALTGEKISGPISGDAKMTSMLVGMAFGSPDGNEGKPQEGKLQQTLKDVKIPATIKK